MKVLKLVQFMFIIVQASAICCVIDCICNFVTCWHSDAAEAGIMLLRLMQSSDAHVDEYNSQAMTIIFAFTTTCCR